MKTHKFWDKMPAGKILGVSYAAMAAARFASGGVVIATMGSKLELKTWMKEKYGKNL